MLNIKLLVDKMRDFFYDELCENKNKYIVRYIKNAIVILCDKRLSIEDRYNSMIFLLGAKYGKVQYDHKSTVDELRELDLFITKAEQYLDTIIKQMEE